MRRLTPSTALHIFSEAIHSDYCKKGISRSCILDYIDNTTRLKGVCESYSMSKGERQSAPFYVYARCEGNDQKIRLDARWYVAGDSGELSPNDKWCK